MGYIKTCYLVKYTEELLEAGSELLEVAYLCTEPQQIQFVHNHEYPSRRICLS